MKGSLKEFLFTKHILVSETGKEIDPNEAFSAIIALGEKFSIRITKGANLATKEMIRDAARCLGEYVPEPFYRGFPGSVRELTEEQLLFDQLLHYSQTYGMGWFDRAGHSQVEEVYDRVCDMRERTDVRDFVILSEYEAGEALKGYLKALLGSTRPLNGDQLMFLLDGYDTYGKDILPDKIPCKDTVIRFLYGKKDLDFCRHLKLSDTIKLLQFIQIGQYQSENLRKLNLTNQDRKFLTSVIDWFVFMNFAGTKTYCDFTECFEKRKIWCGLLHHLHYHCKIPDSMMNKFIDDIRSGKNYSAYSLMEDRMKRGYYPGAASALLQYKGESGLMRHLNYILSRCDEHEAEEVLKCLE